MSKSVSFSETPTEHLMDGDELDDDEVPNESQSRHINKFKLLELIESPDQADSSYSEVDHESADDIEDEDLHQTIEDKSDSRRAEQASSASRRKSRKKRGKKASRSKNKDLKDLENEVEALSRAIVLHTSANQQNNDSLRFKMLKVDMRNLIPEAEIKRMFGKTVIREDKQNRIRHHPGSNLQRSRFVSAAYFETKSSGGPSGPKMDLDEFVNSARKNDRRHTTGYNPETEHVVDPSSSTSAIFNSDEPIYFRFIHDRQYQAAQRLFLKAVHQGNPDDIVQSLNTAPLHAESLIQLSHIVRVSEDFKTASECIERALVVFERGFHPKFNLATATCRLTFKRPENRTFFIAIFKHIIYCHRRGLRRTPFEYCKLLLSLEPENDPLSAVQMLDFFALRSEEYDYIIDFYKKWDKSQKLPNMSYSVALAYFMRSRSSKQTKEENGKNCAWADEFLQKALLIFPNFIIPLLEACSGEPSEELKQCTYFDYSVYGTNYKHVPETVEVLMNLYVKRTYSLWKQKPVMKWLERNVELMVNKFKIGDLTDERRHIQHWHAFPKVAPKNLLRHIVLCDLDMKIPPSASSSTFLDIDPYPPSDSIVSYDPTWKDISDTVHGDEGSLFGNLGGLLLRSFLPSFSLREQQYQGRPSEPTTSQGSSASDGQNQQSDGSRVIAATNEDSQITMADYSLDDDEEVATFVDGVQDGRYSEMQSAIRDMASSVTNLLNMQTTIRTLQRSRDDEDDQDGDTLEDAREASRRGGRSNQ